MSLFFTFVYIHVVKDVVHKDVALFHNIWGKKMKNKVKLYLWLSKDIKNIMKP
jgi:hypothetical protein